MYHGELDGEFLHYRQRENDEKGPYLFKLSDFFISLRLFQKKNHCLLSLYDDIDCNNSDFSQIIEKKLGCGLGEWPSACDQLDVISDVLGSLRTIQIYTKILSSSR